MFPFPKFRFGAPTRDYRTDLTKNVDFAAPSPELEQQPFQDFASSMPEEDPTNFMSLYREISERRNGPAMEAYRKFLEQEYPTRETTPVGKLTRLSAILSGAAAGFTNPGSGASVAQNIMDRPFADKIRQYSSEGNRLAQAASLEETQGKNNIAAVKAIGDLQDKERDNNRLESTAKALINSRNINAERTKQLIEQDGGKFHLDASTGIGYIVRLDGSRTPVGKFDLSTGEKLDETFKKQGNQSRLIAGREAAKDSRTLSRGKELESVRQGNRIELEGVRQKNRTELTKERADLAARNAASKVGGGTSALNKIRQNLQGVRALVDTNPDKYSDIWDESTNELTNKIPEVGTPEYDAYVEVYNELYKGVKSLSTSTKSGNKIIRDK